MTLIVLLIEWNSTMQELFKFDRCALNCDALNVCMSSILWICCNEQDARHRFASLKIEYCAHTIVAFFAQLIIITYVIKFQWRKLYYELSEIQRCKSYWNSIVAHWVVLRWTLNKLNFVNLRSQDKDAKRCRASQLIAKFIELISYKHSKHHNSIRYDRISIFFASLNFAQFIVQFTSWKLFNICDD